MTKKSLSKMKVVASVSCRHSYKLKQRDCKSSQFKATKQQINSKSIKNKIQKQQMSQNKKVLQNQQELQIQDALNQQIQINENIQHKNNYTPLGQFSVYDQQFSQFLKRLQINLSNWQLNLIQYVNKQQENINNSQKIIQSKNDQIKAQQEELQFQQNQILQLENIIVQFDHQQSTEMSKIMPYTSKSQVIQDYNPQKLMNESRNFEIVRKQQEDLLIDQKNRYEQQIEDLSFQLEVQFKLEETNKIFYSQLESQLHNCSHICEAHQQQLEMIRDQFEIGKELSEKEAQLRRQLQEDDNQSILETRTKIDQLRSTFRNCGLQIEILNKKKFRMLQNDIQ